MSGDVKRVRVFVGGMPRLLRDIVEDIVRSQADMEIVCGDWSDDMAAALERRHADVVILQDTATAQPGSPTRHPRWGGHVAEGRLVIVTYSERDDGAFSFQPLSIAELSPQALVQAIRQVRPASKGHE